MDIKMRTGKGRTFSDHEAALRQAEAAPKAGKGIIGGDLSRQPERRRGLRAHLDPASLREGLTELPEIRRFHESDEERDATTAYLAHRPLEIEIGFGGGQFLLERASRHPDVHFVGCEIRRHLCVSAVERIVARELENVRIIYEDMRQNLPILFADQSLRRCSVFFPDPWWKKRHVKRRILVPAFLDLMHQKLAEDGVLHIKTDVMPYAEAIEALFDDDPRYVRRGEELDHLFAGDLPTEREAFCQRKGLPFAEFRYTLA